MQEEQNNDLNLRVLGTGCLASMGTGCLGAIFILILAFTIGSQAVRNTPAFILFSSLVAFVILIATGYFVARAAQKHRVAVNFHVIIYGIILMVIGLLGFIPTKASSLFNPQMLAVLQLAHLIRWLLTIPLMLLGASWSKEEEIS